MKRARIAPVAVLAAALLLAACGGGGGDDPPQKSIPVPDFITWVGSANGSIVLDANGERYQVTQSPSCVWDPAQSLLIVNWCQVPGDPIYRLRFVDRYVVVTGHRTKNGTCIGVFADEATGLRVDIWRQGDVMRFSLGTEYVTGC